MCQVPQPPQVLLANEIAGKNCLNRLKSNYEVQAWNNYKQAASAHDLLKGVGGGYNKLPKKLIAAAARPSVHCPAVGLLCHSKERRWGSSPGIQSKLRCNFTLKCQLHWLRFLSPTFKKFRENVRKFYSQGSETSKNKQTIGWPQGGRHPVLEPSVKSQNHLSWNWSQNSGK